MTPNYSATRKNKRGPATFFNEQVKKTKKSVNVAQHKSKGLNLAVVCDCESKWQKTMTLSARQGSVYSLRPCMRCALFALVDDEEKQRAAGVMANDSHHWPFIVSGGHWRSLGSSCRHRSYISPAHAGMT